MATVRSFAPNMNNRLLEAKIQEKRSTKTCSSPPVALHAPTARQCR